MAIVPRLFMQRDQENLTGKKKPYFRVSPTGQRLRQKIQTSYYLCHSLYINNVFYPFAVDGSPVSVHRYKAIFEQDQLSAERAREPGTHFGNYCKQYVWEIDSVIDGVV